MISRFSCFISLLLVVHATGNASPQVGNDKRGSKLKPSISLPANITIPAVIVFGDSMMDAGNNNHIPTLLKCDFPPYGRVFPGGIATGRFSDGRVPCDFIAEMLGITKTLPAYLDPNVKPEDLLKGVVFASGGSGYDPLTAELNSVISVWDQLIYFKEYIKRIKQIVGEKQAKFIIENSLFLVVSTANDIGKTSSVRKSQYDPNSYTDYLSDLASDFTKNLYGLGARRIGVFGAQPVGCKPVKRAGGTGKCAEDLNQMAIQFNLKLPPKLDSLQKELPNSRIVVINIYNILLNIIQNPKNYGFEVADRACCGLGKKEVAILCNRYNPWTCLNSSAHVFWDSYHPCERTYQIMVENLLPKYITKFF